MATRVQSWWGEETFKLFSPWNDQIKRSSVLTCHFLSKYYVLKYGRGCICPPNGAEAVPQVWDEDWGSSGKQNKPRLIERFVELWVWFKPIVLGFIPMFVPSLLSWANGNRAVDVHSDVPCAEAKRCSVTLRGTGHTSPHLTGTKTTSTAVGTWYHFLFYREMYEWGLWTRPAFLAQENP